MTDIDLTTRPDTVTLDDGTVIHIRWDATWHSPSAYQANVVDVNRGHCIHADGFYARADWLANPTVGTQWHTIDGRPIAIDGIPTDDMPAAIDAVADAVCAHRAYCAARKTRVEATLAALRAAAAVAAAETTAHTGWTAMQAMDRLRGLALIAGREGLISIDQIAAAAGYDDAQTRYLTMLIQAESPDQPGRYLSLTAAEFAARLGILPTSFASMRSRGHIPGPDDPTGKGWLLTTVEDFIASRPGAGARTDLQARR